MSSRTAPVAAARRCQSRRCPGPLSTLPVAGVVAAGFPVVGVTAAAAACCRQVPPLVAVC